MNIESKNVRLRYYKGNEMGKYYKVVREIDGKYYSYSNRFKEIGLELGYCIGKETVPEVGKIFIFKNFRCAKRFFKKGSHLNVKILEVKADKVEKAEYCLDHMYTKSNVINYWENDEYVLLTRVPEGTLFADSVVPVKVVKGVQYERY